MKTTTTATPYHVSFSPARLQCIPLLGSDLHESSSPSGRRGPSDVVAVARKAATESLNTSKYTQMCH